MSKKEEPDNKLKTDEISSWTTLLKFNHPKAYNEKYDAQSDISTSLGKLISCINNNNHARLRELIENGEISTDVINQKFVAKIEDDEITLERIDQQTIEKRFNETLYTSDYVYITAIHLAAGKASLEIFELLRESGADIDKGVEPWFGILLYDKVDDKFDSATFTHENNSQDTTTLDIAKQRGYDSLIKLLHRCGVAEREYSDNEGEGDNWTPPPIGHDFKINSHTSQMGESSDTSDY